MEFRLDTAYEFYSRYSHFIQIIASSIIGGIIGIEREIRGKAAGVRTFSILAAASCLFAIISLNAIGAHDTTRIAAQVVTGVGFLTGGVIMHKGTTVEGLTTAASLFFVTGLGLAIGYGYILLATTSAILLLIIMEVFGVVTKFINSRIKNE